MMISVNVFLKRRIDFATVSLDQEYRGKLEFQTCMSDRGSEVFADSFTSFDVSHSVRLHLFTGSGSFLMPMRHASYPRLILLLLVWQSCIIGCLGIMMMVVVVVRVTN